MVMQPSMTGLGRERVNNDRSTYVNTKVDVLLLSSSLLTDRMFLHTRLLNRLSQQASVKVWATSVRNPRFRDVWSESPATIEDFPAVLPFKEFPFNYLRRLNAFVWDFRQLPPSGLSAMRHIRNRDQRYYTRALKLPARLLALLKMEQSLED